MGPNFHFLLYETSAVWEFPISIALQIGNAACVLGTVSDRDAFEEIYYIYPNFFYLYIIAAFKKILPVDCIVAGLSSLLVVFFCYWYSGWYGVPYSRCRPRVCVFSPQHDDTHGT